MTRPSTDFVIFDLVRAAHYSAAPSLSADLNEAQRPIRMLMERLVSYGRIPPGVTVYRRAPLVWLELPDPEKAR